MIENLIAKVTAFLNQFCIVCKIPCDKQMHFMSGFIIAALLTPLVGFYSVLIVAIIALAKEIYDYLHPESHTADFWDWFATTLGGLIGFIVVNLLK